MSYQVLARKWRPKTFREMVGQAHVLKALINALDHGRLHHAYLFTGTRGVGKTTIARILAKSLNCETGVSSEPCGTCGACTEINEGRFIDLIEVDAASRTKVEDTRELLENVQYAPTRGRYKVYLIDEVHMLSGHSFNALLKTLEEPPSHVKFLLATTDPQKLPITILSRCLQFSLKAMTPDKIVGHLQHVLTEEMVSFEDPALWAIGKAADGSMRDALSLTDQSIAFGNGKVIESDVQSMLGSIDRAYTFQLLESIISGDAPGLLNVVSALSEQSPDYGGVLADLIGGLHRVAIAQVAPDAVDNSDGDREKIISMASRIAAEDVQLYYQTALIGRKDLPLAPDPRSGFEMVLLRMMLFRPEGILPPTNTQGSGSKVQNAPARQTGGAQYAAPNQGATSQVMPSQPVNNGSPVMSAVQSGGQTGRMQQARAALEGSGGNPAVASSPGPHAKPAVLSPIQPSSAVAVAAQQMPNPVEPPQALIAQPSGSNVIPISEAPRKASTPSMSAPSEMAKAPLVGGVMSQPYGDEWADLLGALTLNGSVLNFARNCGLESTNGNQWTLSLGPRHESLFRTHHIEALQKAIEEEKAEQIILTLEIKVPSKDTPDTLSAKRRSKRLENAEGSLRNDPFVMFLFDAFNGVLDKDSIKPLD
ncbi:hypothetical protein A9Q81_16495 [Gammaproteobacteria bacterium 42_54_T18]|nr:hypothetical protein A9Q81_16495 [Gammaproteobacteria bacterium 42_54_T18]